MLLLIGRRLQRGLSYNHFMNIDLHTHSFFSDGENSPEEIVLEAVRKGVTLLSITDHNFLPEAELLKLSEKRISLIQGIEISTLFKTSTSEISLHVLGYGKKLNHRLLNKELMGTVGGYNRRAQSIIAKLNKEFSTLNLDFKSLSVQNNEAYVSRNTLARLLVEHLKGAISIKDALKQYVFVQEDNSWMISPKESFRLIISAGGIPVLAHSGRELQKMGLVKYEKMVSEFVKDGLLGLEIYYPRNTSENINVMRGVAKRFGLYITGGSDWHGHTYTPEFKIGQEVPREEVVSFLNDRRIN